MTPTFDNGVVQLYQGDARQVLRELPPRIASRLADRDRGQVVQIQASDYRRRQ